MDEKQLRDWKNQQLQQWVPEGTADREAAGRACGIIIGVAVGLLSFAEYNIWAGLIFGGFVGYLVYSYHTQAHLNG